MSLAIPRKLTEIRTAANGARMSKPESVSQNG